MTRLVERAGMASRVVALVMTFAAASLFLGRASTPAPGADPLASWNATAPRQAIIDFVEKATKQGGPDFVPAADRIAVFDMDGTLLVEQPVPAAVIPLVAGVKRAVARNSQLGTKPAVAALLKGDMAGVKAAGEQGAADIVSTAIEGMTVEEAASDVHAVMASARHPEFDRLYSELSYRPMLELLDYLRANGFQTWICSGSPVVFTRAFSQESFGIPPEQVMGTSLRTKFAERGGRSVLIYGSDIANLNDKEGKPPTINLAIGKRPVFVAGNVRSDGDVAMMRYSKDRVGPSLQVLINHDDSTREYAYSEKDGASLNAAARYGFVVVSMKNDWATVFSPGIARRH